MPELPTMEALTESNATKTVDQSSSCPALSSANPHPSTPLPTNDDDDSPTPRRKNPSISSALPNGVSSSNGKIEGAEAPAGEEEDENRENMAEVAGSSPLPTETPRSDIIDVQNPIEDEMNTLNTLRRKSSLRSMTKVGASADLNTTASAGAARARNQVEASSQETDPSKERLTWSNEGKVKEFDNRLAPTRLNDVKETRYDIETNYEIYPEDVPSSISNEGSEASNSSGDIPLQSSAAGIPPSILKASKKEDVPVSKVPGMLLPSSADARSGSVKRLSPPTPVNRKLQVKRFTKGSAVESQSFVLLVFEIEEEYVVKDSAESQAVSIEVPETKLRRDSKTINALLLKKQESKGTFDPQDKICWLPKVSRSNLARGVATIYMIPFLEYITSDRHEGGKALLQWSAGIQFDLFQHWWSWVKCKPGDNFGDITSPWRKDRILMMADVLGASTAYIQEVRSYKTHVKHYTTEEADMAYRNKHHPTWLIREDPAMYELLKAKGMIWRKTK